MLARLVSDMLWHEDHTKPVFIDRNDNMMFARGLDSINLCYESITLPAMIPKDVFLRDFSDDVLWRGRSSPVKMFSEGWAGQVENCPTQMWHSWSWISSLANNCARRLTWPAQEMKMTKTKAKKSYGRLQPYLCGVMEGILRCFQCHSLDIWIASVNSNSEMTSLLYWALLWWTIK